MTLNLIHLLLGAPLLSGQVFLNESRQLRVFQGSDGTTQHVDLGGHEFAAGVESEALRLQISDDFVQQTLSFADDDLLLNFHDHRRVGLAQGRFAHQRTVGLVVFIVRVGQSLVQVNIAVDALGQAQRSGRMDGLQGQVLDGLALSGFSFVAEGLEDNLIHGLDALDDEVSLAGTATDDADQVDVLKIENVVCEIFEISVLQDSGIFFTEILFSQPAPLTASHLRPCRLTYWYRGRTRHLSKSRFLMISKTGKFWQSSGIANSSGSAFSCSLDSSLMWYQVWHSPVVQPSMAW